MRDGRRPKLTLRGSTIVENASHSAVIIKITPAATAITEPMAVDEPLALGRLPLERRKYARRVPGHANRSDRSSPSCEEQSIWSERIRGHGIHA
jgi:hypothetical protein